MPSWPNMDTRRFYRVASLPRVHVARAGLALMLQNVARPVL